MRIIGLEEHVVLPEMLEAWAKNPHIPRIPELGFGDAPMARRLRDVGDLRLADMADQGIDMQVLSVTNPGVQNLARTDAVPIARVLNDRLADIVRGNPERFDAFATLPTPDPDAAAAELERAVTKLNLRGAMLYGRTGDRLADAPEFDPIYAMAARLGVPLYFHPQAPLPAITSTYYSGFGAKPDFAFGAYGLGWYYDLGVQMLRMVFSGVFDRHPDLQVILGHWGEVILFYLDHVGVMAHEGLHLDRPLIDYFRQNFWITGSGTVSQRYFRWAAEVVGTERLLYSTDYPYTFKGNYPLIETSGGVGRSFLEDSTFSDQEKAAIGADHWQGLMARRKSPPQ